MLRICHTFLSVHCSAVVTCWERAGLLALLYVMFSCVYELSHVVSWIMCGTGLYRFLIFAFLLYFISLQLVIATASLSGIHYSVDFLFLFFFVFLYVEFETIRGSLMRPKWRKPPSLAQKICTLYDLVLWCNLCFQVITVLEHI